MGQRAMTKRKIQQIPEPFEPCFLEGAVSSTIAKQHQYVVPYPAEAGPQPCLIEIQEPNSIRLKWGVVILPEDAPRTLPTNNITHGRLLALIAHCSANVIERAENDSDGDLWCGKTYEEPPFRMAGWTNLAKELHEFMEQAKKETSGLPTKSLDRAAKLQTQLGTLSAVWEPYPYFASSWGAADELQSDIEVIQAWPEWDARLLTLPQRLREFTSFAERPVPIDIKKCKKAYENFKKRCSFLRLRCSVKAKRGTRAIEWEEWLRETKQ